MCKFSLHASVQKQKNGFFCENCAIFFLLFNAFQTAIKSQNPMTGSMSKNRFSRVKVK